MSSDRISRGLVRLETTAGPSAWIHPDFVRAIVPALLTSSEADASVVWFSGNPGDNTLAAGAHLGRNAGMASVVIDGEPDVVADRLGFDTSGILKPSRPQFDPELAENAKQVDWTPGEGGAA